MIKEKTKIIPMTFDIVFKSVLNDSKTEGYLIDIISGITKIDKKHIKGNIVFKNTELSKGEIKEKGKIADLIVEVKDNVINLEMNKNYYDGLFDKNDRYIEKIKDGIVTKGSKYSTQKKVIQINFDNFELFDERIVIKFRMIDEERGLVRSDFIYNTDTEIYHINLKRIKEMYYNKNELTKLEKELLVMTLDDEEELQKVSKGCKEMEIVADKISKVSKEEELQGIYDIEEQEKFIRDRISFHAYNKGMSEGEKEGAKKGIIITAKNLLKQNIPIDVIANATGLSKEEIEKL